MTHLLSLDTLPINHPIRDRIVYGCGVDRPLPVIVREGVAAGSVDGKPTYEYKGKIYTSARQLLIAMTGHPHGRHWTFNRYFKQGRYSRGRSSLLGESLGGFPIDLFVVCNPPSPKPLELVTVYPRMVMSPQKIQGIDLQRRAGEVTKLLFAGYGTQIHANHYDADDVLQEVYKGLIIRNRGKCPWDPTKSSFGHYVHMVAGCIMSNYHRKLNRQRQMEQTGIRCGDTVMDVGQAYDRMGSSTCQTHDLMLYRDFAVWLGGRACVGSEKRVAMQILPMVMGHYERGEIATATGLSRVAVSRALVWLKGQMGAWTLDGFVI